MVLLEFYNLGCLSPNQYLIRNKTFSSLKGFWNYSVRCSGQLCPLGIFKWNSVLGKPERVPAYLSWATIKKGQSSALYSLPSSISSSFITKLSVTLQYLPEGDLVDGIVVCVLNRNHLKGFILPVFRVVLVIIWEFTMIEEPWVIPTLKKRMMVKKWWQKNTEAANQVNILFRIILPILRIYDRLENVTSKQLEILFTHREKSIMIAGITSHPANMLRFCLLLVREQLRLCAHSGITKKHAYWKFTEQPELEWHYWFTSQTPLKLSSMKGIPCPRDGRFQITSFLWHPDIWREDYHLAIPSTWNKNWFTKESQNFPGAE